MSMQKHLLAVGFSLLSWSVFAEAPVVEESDNFALLDDNQSAMVQPESKSAFVDNDAEQIAIAQHQDNVGSQANIQLLDKLKSVQQELQELRGQLEVQAYHLKKLEQQQLTFYKDIDSRLGGHPPPQTSQTVPEATNQSLTIDSPKKPAASSFYRTAPKNNVSTNHKNPAEAQISYLAAYDLLKSKHFDEALEAMQAFVKNYPQGGYTANAHYWLGELYMVKKEYGNAIGHFEIVLNQFPSSSKRAASLLKIGYALAASGHEIEAMQRLQEVIRHYPDTPTAELALAKLKSIST